VFNRTLTSSLEKINVDSDTRMEIENQREKLAAIDVPQHIESEQRTQIKKSIDESFLAGFRIVMLCGSVLALLSAATAWLSIKPAQNHPPTTSA